MFVVTQPYASDDHRYQQATMARMLAEQFPGHPLVSYVNLGEGVADLKDPTIAYDGMHLTPPGNERIAERLVDPVLQALQAPKGPRRVVQQIQPVGT